MPQAYVPEPNVPLLSVSATPVLLLHTVTAPPVILVGAVEALLIEIVVVAPPDWVQPAPVTLTQ